MSAENEETKKLKIVITLYEKQKMKINLKAKN